MLTEKSATPIPLRLSFPLGHCLGWVVRDKLGEAADGARERIAKGHSCPAGPIGLTQALVAQRGRNCEGVEVAGVIGRQYIGPFVRHMLQSLRADAKEHAHEK